MVITEIYITEGQLMGILFVTYQPFGNNGLANIGTVISCSYHKCCHRAENMITWPFDRNNTMCNTIFLCAIIWAISSAVYEDVSGGFVV